MFAQRPLTASPFTARSLTRRSFLAGTAAAALVPVLGGCNHAAPEARAPKLAGLRRTGGLVVAGHAWTWGKGTLFEAIDHTHAAGLDALEVYLMGMPISAETGSAVLDEATPDDLLDKVRAKCASAGVRIVNAYIGQKQWTRIGTDESALRRFFEFGRKMNLAGFTGEPAEYQWDLVERMVRAFDVTFSVHNHPRGFAAEYFRGEYRYWDPRYTATRLRGRDERFGVCLDTGHVARSGLDNVAVLREVGGRCLSAHLKDVNEPKPEAHDVPYGTGIVDVKALLAGFRRLPLRGHVGLEYEWAESPTFGTDVTGLVGYIQASA
ncbi:MAG TPA: TIM barrel protein [Humisphaera sp.]